MIQAISCRAMRRRTGVPQPKRSVPRKTCYAAAWTMGRLASAWALRTSPRQRIQRFWTCCASPRNAKPPATCTCARMALGQTGLAIEMIEGARRRGLDITTEAYPYAAGQTNLDSAVFDDGWQERLAVTYKDLPWVATGEGLKI